MDEREDRVSSDGSASPAGRHEAFRREDYSDAHFERAEESTVPPRYYTPPVRTAKESGRNTARRGISVPTAVCCVLGAAVLGGLAGGAWTERSLSGRVSELETGFSECVAAVTEMQNTRTAGSAAEAVSATADGVRMDAADIYAEATRHVVAIKSEISVTNYFGITSSGAVNGSGFVISEDGYILTNYHVIEDACSGNSEITVITYDRAEYSAFVVGTEAANDLAILKIEADGLTPARLGDSDSLRVGDVIYAVGNPLGELEFSMSTGHVSALDRIINTEESESVNMFQIDAAVNEGNSGGPVYNGNGEVIGIVTAKYTSSGVEGIGFAIPINDAKSISEDLITKGYVTGKAYMGITYNPEDQLDPRYAAVMGIPAGLTVHDVEASSAADRAGMQAYDIIISIGDYRVESYSDLRQAMRHYSAGDSTEITVYRVRDNTEISLPIVFDEATPENQT